MTYSGKELQEIAEQFSAIQEKRDSLDRCLIQLLVSLKNNQASTYLSQGVFRRVKIVFKSLYNIYEIFPPERNVKLTTNELDDLCINLHAFFINTAGIFDNLGWVHALEKNIYDDRPKNKRPA